MLLAGGNDLAGTMFSDDISVNAGAKMQTTSILWSWNGWCQTLGEPCRNGQPCMNWCKEQENIAHKK